MKYQRFQFSGLIPQKSVCEVVFTEDVGGTKRVRHVEVPWGDFLADNIAAGMDTAARRRLIEVWSGVDIADPLF